MDCNAADNYVRLCRDYFRRGFNLGFWTVGGVMAKHKESVIFSLRKTGSGRQNGHVRTKDKSNIVIELPWILGSTIVIDRKTARLLAKRINECLDYSKR